MRKKSSLSNDLDLWMTKVMDYEVVIQLDANYVNIVRWTNENE